MAEEKCYDAILDTDFVAKANIIQADSENVLADRVLEFPGYCFYCHQMMEQELDDHGTNAAKRWLQDKIEMGVIRRYSDGDILDLLEEVVGSRCYSLYLNFLKISCDIYEKSYFEEKYAPLSAMEEKAITRERFLKELEACDKSIGPHQSLGEKKAYVLLQTLYFMKGEGVFLFCSDDSSARRGLADAARIPCISIMAVFMKLKNMGMEKEDAKRYFHSFAVWCAGHKQTQVYVWEFHGSYRRVKRDLQAVFDGLYREEFALMLNGDLLIKENKA